MKAMQGIKMSYRLHRIIQQDMYQPLRGIQNEESPTSLNQHLYSIIRTNRGHRRALLNSMLNLFDDTSVCIMYNNRACYEYPTMHYFGIPRHTQLMMAYMTLTKYFWKFQ